MNIVNAWPRPGSSVCAHCGKPVVEDRKVYSGWRHALSKEVGCDLVDVRAFERQAQQAR